MIECERCGRLYPEVVGAPSQVCPHCEHETGAAAPRREAEPRAIPADPVGAITLAARVGAREYPRLLLLWLPALLVELAAGAIILAYSDALGIPDDGTSTTGQDMQLLGVAMPLLLLFFSARLATWSFVAARVFAFAAPDAPRVAWRRLLPQALLGGFVLTLAYMAGALLLLIGWFVVLHWFAYVPAFVARGGRVTSAFDESRRFAREHATFGFTALLALVLIGVYGGWYALSLALDGWLAELAPALVLWLTGPLVPLLAASYVALASTEEKEAPAPRSGAAEVVRASTKCPQCATLIPYTPTGAPVDVVCPSCGRAGRVL